MMLEYHELRAKIVALLCNQKTLGKEKTLKRAKQGRMDSLSIQLRRNQSSKQGSLKTHLPHSSAGKLIKKRRALQTSRSQPKTGQAQQLSPGFHQL